jgi:SARP family transcriptional regulator, regulator of embCAB operon
LRGAFELAAGAVPLVLPGSSQRLLAFLALQERTVTRSMTAATLWPDASEAHAHASLRSALSRLDEITREAVEVDFLDLRLAATVTVDIRESRALAHRLVIVDISPSEADMTAEAITALSSELLPDWYDEWVLIEAEDWRQLRLHALEALAERLTVAERYADAIAAARAAIGADPLRETAHAALIRVHLAEGNQSEALAAYNHYCVLLHNDLGIEPTARLTDLVRDIRR